MRLIHTSSRRLVQFNDDDSRPPYAILSHTWSDDEMTHEHYVRHTMSHNESLGYKKILAACAEAQRLQLEWLWADTVCISRANGDQELSEALNSMYNWYRGAAICLVYLADVTGSGKDKNVWQQIRESRYFTRGWTLQELITPTCVLFFDQEWRRISYLSDCAVFMSELTGIPSLGQESGVVPYRYTVAQRMSWASRRTTRREEDLAYSLMGIFDVNMVIQYGEGGESAFRRLQREIFEKSDDLTIFAWDDIASTTNAPQMSPLFAPSPSYFSGSAYIGKPQTPLRSIYHMIVDGYRVPFYWEPDSSESWDDPSTADIGLLNCVDTRRPDELIGLNLRILDEGEQGETRLRLGRISRLSGHRAR